MTNYGGGLINGILLYFDSDPFAIIKDNNWARIAVIVPTLWLGFGYNSLVMYAGLLNIPKDYYEAATLDGAGWWRKLIKITLPGEYHACGCHFGDVDCGGVERGRILRRAVEGFGRLTGYGYESE